MYPLMHNIFEDKSDGNIFTCFSFWHFFYIFLIIAAVSLSVYFFRNKDQSVKNRVLNIFIGVAFGLYMLDFFMMPFAYGEIDVDKLPFHSCTAFCVLCFLSRHNKFLWKYRLNFAVLAFISNLMYIAYPSGVMSYEINAFSYRAVQTLLFHSTMTAYGLLAILLGSENLELKNCHRPLVILGLMTVWATIGNTLYSGAADGYDHDFNWFFIKNDPFGALPEDIAMYIAPFLNIFAFFALDILIRLLFVAIKGAKRSKIAY